MRGSGRLVSNKDGVNALGMCLLQCRSHHQLLAGASRQQDYSDDLIPKVFDVWTRGGLLCRRCGCEGRWRQELMKRGQLCTFQDSHLFRQSDMNSCCRHENQNRRQMGGRGSRLECPSKKAAESRTASQKDTPGVWIQWLEQRVPSLSGRQKYREIALAQRQS